MRGSTFLGLLSAVAVAAACPAVAAAAAPDFDGDGFADLVVGVPGEDVGMVEGTGAVNVLYGRSTGLSAHGDQLWHQDVTGVDDEAEFDFFGAALAPGT